MRSSEGSALAFELTQFSGVVASVADSFRTAEGGAHDLYKVPVNSRFVTECKVLDDARMAERVVPCEATGVVMRACFITLLGHPTLIGRLILYQLSYSRAISYSWRALTSAKPPSIARKLVETGVLEPS